MPFTRLITILLLGSVATTAAAQAPHRDLAPYLMNDRTAEVALARTAAPRAISDSATVLVLTPTGFVEAAHGTNGFTCLVLRGFSGSLSAPSTWWNPKIRAPLCLNPAAVRTALPSMKQRADLVLAGVPEADVVARTYHAFATHELPKPETGAMAYMMSHQQYLADVDPTGFPHVMFFFAGGHKGADWGAGDGTSPIIDGGVDAKTGIGLFLVPLPQWSDGSAFTHQ